MNNYFVHINKQGTFIKKAKEDLPMIPLLKIKELIGDESGQSWIECVYHQFDDPDIIIICDEEFLLKNYIHPTIITKRNVVIRGCCVIVGLTDTEDGKDISCLSMKECLTALQQLKFLPG
jgi:hypothetical protein